MPRAKAFDYYDPHLFWTQENSSGLEKRTALMLGVREALPDSLVFSNRFILEEELTGWSWKVENEANETLLESLEVFTTETEAKSNLENAIVSGLLRGHYEIQEIEGVFRFVLQGKTGLLAISTTSDFPDEAAAELIIEEVMGIFNSEFIDNPQSNLKNLTPGLMNYLQYTIAVDEVVVPPTFSLEFSIYSKPFTSDPEFLICKENIVKPQRKD